MTEAVPPQDRTKPTPIIDAARRAMCEAWPTVEGYRPCHYESGCACGMVPLRVLAALRAACPKEPPDEWIEAMAVAICCGSNCDAANACAGHDLSAEGYAERYGCLSKERQDEALAAYRAQLLWQELWGEP